jgi:3-oxoacyl-[acyl-carrier protein] reductase
MGVVPEPLLVLGASGGLGSAISRHLAGRGYRLILHGRHSGRLEKLAGELDGSASIEMADLSDSAEVGALFARLKSSYDKLGGMIFSVATPFPNKLTHRVSWDVFQAQIDTQLKALHLSASAAFPFLADTAQTRRLVVVGTEFDVTGPPVKTAAYVAAKAAITAYAQVIAKEWVGRGVRVHIVAPGLVKTALVAEMPDEYLDEVARGLPEKKLTTAEDVAGVVEFLLTDAADTLYGTPIRVSRGQRL